MTTSSDSTTLKAAYAALQQEAEQLVGGRYDLVRRAAVYHHLYAHSNGNHAFPLIAAHGALWAHWYFCWGMRLGHVFALPHTFSLTLRRKRLADLHAYADAYKDINRQVCIETYSTYYFAQRYGHDAAADQVIPGTLLNALKSCHAAADAREILPAQEKRDLFMAFFLWEQANIVGPAVTAATDAFHWPSLKYVALKPSIRFAYFPRQQRLNFHYFADTAERIEKGARAFDIAEAVGLSAVESALRHYNVMPSGFHVDPSQYFQSLMDTYSRPTLPLAGAN